MRPKSRLLVLFMLVSFMSTAFFVPQTVASGESWLTGWDYRKELTIDEATGADADYPLDLIVYHGSGVDTTEAIYLDSKCQADFDDVIFTDADGSTKLDYWREVYTASINATFWVEVGDAIIEGTTIFLYYGNVGASTTSDGTGVFLFFDDFESNDFSAWDTAEANWEIASEGGDPFIPMIRGTYAAFGDADGTGREIYQDNLALTDDIMIHSWVRFAVDNHNEYPMYGLDGEADTLYLLASQGDDFDTFDGVGWMDYTADIAVATTWIRCEVAVDFTNSLYRAWFDRVAGDDTRPNKDDGGNIIDEVDRMGSITQTVADKDTWLDDFYIRLWQLSELYISGSLGEEEAPVWAWNMIEGDTDLILSVGWSPVFSFGYDAFFIFAGLIMIPLSTMYLVRGGREELSSDKVFYFLILFMMGWAFFIGGILA